MISEPKTTASADWVGLSGRVVEALKLQAARQAIEHAEWGAEYADGDLVFCKENGEPLRPETVLKRFRAITAEARVDLFRRAHPEIPAEDVARKLDELLTETPAADPLPKIRIHDLRHGAATLLLAAGVPLAIVSKMLRHSKVGITADLYGHLVPEVATEAADAMGAVLDAAATERRAERAATTSRPHRVR